MAISSKKYCQKTTIFSKLTRVTRSSLQSTRQTQLLFVSKVSGQKLQKEFDHLKRFVSKTELRQFFQKYFAKLWITFKRCHPNIVQVKINQIKRRMSLSFYCRLLFSHGLSILSLKGVDIVNGIFISLKNFHKETIDSDSFDFVSLTQTYAKFLLTSTQAKSAKPFELSFKKFKFLLSQAWKLFFVLLTYYIKWNVFKNFKDAWVERKIWERLKKDTKWLSRISQLYAVCWLFASAFEFIQSGK